MKVKTHKYPVRSQFLEPCTEAIRSHRAELLAGEVIEIHSSPRGFNRRVLAKIEAADPTCFRTDKEYEETWLSARIRAAARALYQEGLFGQFALAHQDGLLIMRLLHLQGS